MQRKWIVIILCSFGLMTILAACKLPWELGPDVTGTELAAQTDLPTLTPTPTETLTPTPTETPAGPPTETPTATPTATEVGLPAGPLVVIDGNLDGVDCVNGMTLENTPPEIDVQKLVLDGGEESVQIQVGFKPELDLAAAIAVLNLPFSIQVGIADPEFPLPPADPVAYNFHFQNEIYLFVWFNSPNPVSSVAAQYRDGIWTQLPEPSPAGIEFTGTFTVTITVPNSAMPQAGRLSVGTVIDNRFCDAAGVNDAGPTILFTFDVTRYVFTEEK